MKRAGLLILTLYIAAAPAGCGSNPPMSVAEANRKITKNDEGKVIRACPKSPVLS
jgi:hypothetical protein